MKKGDVMYPVGTPVRVRGHVDGVTFRGKKGVIRNVPNIREPYYAVEFNRVDLVNFHSCGGIIKDGFGYNIREERMTLKETEIGDKVYTCGFDDESLNGFELKIIETPRIMKEGQWFSVRCKVLVKENKHKKECFLKEMKEVNIGCHNISYMLGGTNYKDLMVIQFNKDNVVNPAPAKKEKSKDEVKNNFKFWREEMARCNRDGWKDIKLRDTLVPLFDKWGNDGFKDKKYKGTWRNGTMCAMMWVYKDGKHCFNSNIECHADLISLHKGHKQPVVNFVTYLVGVNKLSESMTAFLEWLLNDSYYSSAYITKDPDEALHSGISMDCSVDSNLFCAAAMTTRYIYEYVEKANTWYEMVNNGISMNEAWVMCHIIHSIDGTLSKSHLSGHCSFHPNYIGVEGFNNYIKGNLKNPYGKPFSSAKEYTNISRIWGNGGNKYGEGVALWYISVWEHPDILSFGKKIEAGFGGEVLEIGSENLGPVTLKMMEILKIEREENA